MWNHLNVSIFTGVKKYKCRYCDKSFYRYLTRYGHEKIHMGKKHICQTCGRGFTTSTHLKTHMLTHTRERSHKCQYCEKIFKFACNLRKHELLHNTVKMYRCTMCDEKFNRLAILRKHKRNQHEAVVGAVADEVIETNEIEGVQTVEMVETFKTIEMFETIETVEMIETIETVETVETIETIETVETIQIPIQYAFEIPIQIVAEIPIGTTVDENPIRTFCDNFE